MGYTLFTIISSLKIKRAAKLDLRKFAARVEMIIFFICKKVKRRLAGGVHDSSDPPGVGMICRTFVCPGGVWHLRSLQSALSHVRPYVRLADSCAT